MKTGVNFIAFDIGSSKIAAAAASITKQGEVNINSQILQYSQGFKSGNITNMTLAENSIIAAIYALEKECDKSIKEAAISLSGVGVKSYYTNHTIKLGSQAITKQDIKKLINKALSDFKVQNQEIIHYFPMEFIINGTQAVDNPTGLYAKELSVQLHLIAADSLMLMNLTKCLAKCQIEVSQIVASIYAAGLACLSRDEKELGSIIIDIGSNTTSFGIFLDGNIVYVSHIPTGSMHVTTDIAKTFSINIQAADKLKILYGNAHSSLLTKDMIIRLDEFDKNSKYNLDLSISTNKLTEIIQTRMKDIFLKIKEQCDRISMDHLLARRIIITGGGAGMPGVKNLADEVFQKKIRIAKPEALTGFLENHNSYMYSTCIGMVKSQASKYQKNSSKYSQECDSGWFSRAIEWLKENI